MKTVLWLVVFLAGFGLMLAAYFALCRVDESAPWAAALMYVGKAEPEETVDAVPYTEARLRLLPLSEFMRGFVQGFESTSPPAVRRTVLSLRESIILDSAFRKNFTPEVLAEGRLPRPGSDEVVRGCAAAHGDAIVVAGRRLEVVGTLRREAALFSKAYLLAPDSPAAGLFAPGATDVLNACIIRMPWREAAGAEMQKRLGAEFPPDRFSVIGGDVRLEAGSYFLYVAGLAVMLLGGSALFVRLYAWLAGVVTWRVLQEPLAVLSRWRRLLYGLHVAVFGLMVLAAAGVYFLPSVQSVLLGAVHSEVAGGSGPLGLAGRVYRSGNIPLAALTTVGINFLAGTLASITIPSAIVPGLGSLMTVGRSLVVGLALAPTTARMSGMMLPHSLTILVEMEAYIVATLFALMVPTYLFRRSEGPTWYRRYGRALLVNLKGLLIVFGILAVVAVYEATEVILQVR